ncbi:MAG: metallophosphoesterase family protein [Clostridia bacterium]|nr:metallophosphoesterase family protein [Clostridia bacterium]
MKLCLICDLHLPYHKGALQYDLLRWAMDDLQTKKADAVVVLGDFTADGDLDVAREFAARIKTLPIPVILLTGNADFRTPAARDDIRAMASPTLTKLGGLNLVALHDGEGRVPEEDFTALEQAGGDTLVFMHHAPKSLSAAQAGRLLDWCEAHPDAQLFHGHLHRSESVGNIHSLQAADPDKAIGENACITYYDTDAKTLEKAYYSCPMPEDFPNWVGISCYHPMDDLPYAIENRVGCIELRSNSLKCDRDGLISLVREWRAAGGWNLSLHMPDLAYSEGKPSCDWAAYIDLARKLGVDRLTVHVPKVSVREVQTGNGVLEAIAEMAAEHLAKLPESCVIGIENMHMSPGEPFDDSRRFGYLPEEALTFMRCMRAKCRQKVGFNLDVGHARNNPPFSQRYPIGTWYAEVGGETVGYHVHQVRMNQGKKENHCPITEFYGKLISYASFFGQWSRGGLNKAPVILEIRPDESGSRYAQSVALFQSK